MPIYVSALGSWQMSPVDPVAPEPVAPDLVSVPWRGSVIVTAFGFLPLGLVALALCARSQRMRKAGDVTAADKAAKVARRVMWITVVVAVLVDLVLIGVIAVLGGFSAAEL